MNPYLQNTKYVKAQSQSQQYGGFWDDAKATITQPFEVAYDYWADKGVVEGMTGFVEEVGDYSATQKQASKSNKHAWKRKLEIAQAYRDAGSWPANVERRLMFVNKAYPNLPSSSQVLAIAPNTIADVFAQSAMFSYITAKLFDKPQFNALGDLFAQKAKTAERKIGVSVADRQKAQKQFSKQWMKVAVEAEIVSSWYNLLQQLQNLISGDEAQARQIKKRLDLLSTREELEFSTQMAKDTSSSIWDLLWVMRGWMGLAGVALMVLYGSVIFGLLAAFLPGFGAAAGRVATTAGKGLAKGAGTVAKTSGKLITSGVKGTGKAITGFARSSIMDAMKQATKTLNDKDFQKSLQNIMNGIQTSGVPVSPALENQLNHAMVNPNLSEADIKRIIKQILTETGV